MRFDMDSYSVVFRRLIVLVALLLPASVVQADVVGDAVGDVAKQVFKQAERELIREYYRSHNMEVDSAQSEDDDGDKGRGKGKGKHGKKGKKGHGGKGLPPGIVKKLERGGALPPGLAKRGLPNDLESRLPPAPRGMERQIVNGKVVLVETATQIVRDIIGDLIN